jgi:hypothetical protein
MKTINELFYLVILQNELSGNKSAALRFSDPDGASGRSGWSFGLCQFDTRHNDQAINCLVDCGFTDGEIRKIVAQTIDVKPLAARLIAHADVIAEYDEAQLSHCINKAVEFNVSHGIIMSDTAAILCVADYVNQYGSEGDGIAAYFNEIDIKRPVIAADVQHFKLEHTKYGREHRKDCERRYNNILEALKKEGL